MYSSQLDVTQKIGNVRARCARCRSMEITGIFGCCSHNSPAPGDPGCTGCAVNAALTWANTLGQSPSFASAPGVECALREGRNSRIVGYQGLSDRSSNQRQSGEKGSSTQTGFPKAPARWATDVSTEITKSNCEIQLVQETSRTFLC